VLRLRLPLLPLFAALSLIAIALGFAVCVASGVPAALTGRNLAAWAVGGGAAFALSRGGARSLPVVAILGPLALAATFPHSGLQGVHRWIGAGPVTLNAALLTLPALVVALAILAPSRRWFWALAALTHLLLIAQPDASQAMAFAAAMAVVAWRLDWALRRKIVLVILFATGAALAWTRADPLAPVAEVEGVLGLAGALSPALAFACLAALFGTAVWPILATRRAAASTVTAGLALTAYLLVTALTPFSGAFPVPLVGVGLSPVLGWWLGVGLLASRLRSMPAAA